MSCYYYLRKIKDEVKFTGKALEDVAPALVYLFLRLDGRPYTLYDFKNIGYPTYWHARGYGLFAANTLGWKVFTDGKQELNFSISAGESATFRYRVIVHSGTELSAEEINKIADKFAKKY